jgi:hypothetical protein
MFLEDTIIFKDEECGAAEETALDINSESEKYTDDEYIDKKELQCADLDEIMERQNEWEAIDELVYIYQEQFRKDIEITESIKRKSEEAAITLINTFYPFLKKYLTVIKTGQINFDNPEQRLFVLLFMDDNNLKSALYSKNKIDRATKASIFYKFNFIKETYGYNDEEEIMTDLQMLFLILAKRYKYANRSFPCYVYNVFRFEVARHIEKFTRNPVNIHYRNLSYEELNETGASTLLKHYTEPVDFEELIYLNESGIPDTTWVQGINCSNIFSNLSPLERKLLIKYYVERYNDKQIAKEYNLHINTCNIRRHKAVEKLAKTLGVKKSEIPRSRNSGADHKDK